MNPITVYAMGIQGPPGAQGPAGPAGAEVLTYTASIPLGGHRMVVLNSAGEAIYADGGIVTHANKVLGMTLGAVSAGALATIQMSGEVLEPTWAWTLDVPIWLGLNGLLTQTNPTTVFSLIVAFPITTTKIFIDVRVPIFLI